MLCDIVLDGQYRGSLKKNNKETRSSSLDILEIENFILPNCMRLIIQLIYALNSLQLLSNQLVLPTGKQKKQPIAFFSHLILC